MSEQKRAEQGADGPDLWGCSSLRPTTLLPLQRNSKVLIYLNTGSFIQQSGQPLKQTRHYALKSEV